MHSLILKNELYADFKFCFFSYKVPTNDQLKSFFDALSTHRDSALFLIYASSGLRNSEVLYLNRFRDVDFKNRSLTPRKEGNRSKHVWVSFFNLEAEHELNQYKNQIPNSQSRLFPISK
jgi:site-specific recombinase XerC